jgi:hypothetical protein
MGWEGAQIKHSQSVTDAAHNQFMLGVFNELKDLSKHERQFIGTYSGWILTRDEYDELNRLEGIKMNALYGIEAKALKRFVADHWDETWEPSWKDAEWTVLADPVSVAANINSSFNVYKRSKSNESQAVKATTNCKFSCNHSSELKIKNEAGRYAIKSTYMNVEKKANVAIAKGDELFLAYHRLIKDKAIALAELDEQDDELAAD